MVTELRERQEAELRTFVQDDGPPLRAKTVELRRAEIASDADHLEAVFSLWARARSAKGWVATVEIRRRPDGALRRLVCSADAPEGLIEALEAWRPSWPDKAPDDPVAMLELNLAQARLRRFYEIALGEVLADWC